MTFKLRSIPWQPLAWAGLLVLLLFQAYAFYFKLPLSLGPRVILQPWLLRQGFVEYESAVDIHTPFMPLLLEALSWLVQDPLRLARLVLVGLLSLSGLLVFLAARRHAGWPAGLLAVFFFVLWSPKYEFGKLWHETFLSPIYLSFFLLYNPSPGPRPLRRQLLLGLLGGLAVLVKQHAALVFLALAAWEAFTAWHFKRPWRAWLRELVVLGAAAALPLLGFILYQWLTAGSLSGLLYWTLLYNFNGVYKSMASLPPTLAEAGVIASSALFLPAVLLFLAQKIRSRDPRWMSLACGMLLLLAGSLTVYPRFNFFHLQPAWSLLAALSAIALGGFYQSLAGARGFVAASVAGIVAFWLLAAGSAYLPTFQTGQPRMIAEYSPMLPVAAEVRQAIGPSGCVFIFPDDEASSNLYYLLRCTPPRYWIFHYPWYMIDPVKGRLLSVLQQDPPRWVVYIPNRWDANAHAPEIVAYIQAHYRQVTPLQSAGGQAFLLERR